MTYKSTLTIYQDWELNQGMLYIASNPCIRFLSGTGECRLGDMAGSCLNVTGS